jgi:hypothetical protein
MGYKKYFKEQKLSVKVSTTVNWIQSIMMGCKTQPKYVMTS